MKRIRQGWNTLRRSKRSGVSLIVALCAVAVLIGLSLSIVYSSSCCSRGPTARSAGNAVISWRSPLHRCWTANCRNTKQ